MKKERRILFVLIIFFILMVILSYFTPILLWDENAYLGNARSHLTTSNYTEDFRYPLLEYIISGLWLITGESIFAAKVLMSLFYVATIYLFYLISKQYIKDNLLLTILFAISSQMIYWGFRIYTDVFVVFFILLSFYFLNKRLFLFSGIAAGLGILAKFTSVLMVAAVIFCLLLRKEVKQSSIFAFGVFLCLSPWLAYNQVKYSNPLWDFFSQLSLTSKYNEFISPLNFIKDMLIYLNMFLIISMIKFKEIIKNEKFRPMFIFCLFYIVYFTFISDVKFSRYLLSIIPFIYLFGWHEILKIKNTEKRKIIISLTIIFSLLLFANTAISIGKEFYCNNDGSIIKTINYLSQEQDTDIISNVWPWFGYYNNLRVHSFYSNIDELSQSHKPKYFIYNEGIGDSYDEIQLKKLTLEKTFEGKCKDRISIYKN